MKHQATNFKKKYNEPLIKDLDEKESSKNKEFIGRRTGKNLGDHIANGNDFLLKNDYTDILETQKRDMYDLYSSDSGTEMSSSQDEDASESESEAEESERENSSNQIDTVYTKNDSYSKTKKRVNPTIINLKEKNNPSQVVVNLKEKKTENNRNSQTFEEKYKNLEEKLLKESPIDDISDVEEENVMKTESESESESEEETPMFNRYNKNPLVEAKHNVHKMSMPNNNIPLQTSAKDLPKISAKNNFKSNRKELWSEKDENKIESKKERESLQSSGKKETKNNLNPKKNINIRNKKIDEPLESPDLKKSKLQVDDTFDKNIGKGSSNKKVGVPKSIGKKSSNLNDKHLLNTNLSTIKKDNNTSNLLTDNEFLKEEEEKLKSKKNLIEKPVKEKKINQPPVNNFQDDDYLGDNNINNNSNTLSLSDEEKDTKINENKLVKNVPAEANKKLNDKDKDKENVTTAKKSKIAIIKTETNSPKKENKKPQQKVNEKNKENIKKPSPSKNEKISKKKKFSQFREENLSDYENEENNKKPKRVAGPPQGKMTENEVLKRSYQYMLSVEPKKVEIQKANEKVFGVDGRYSMRNRVPKLNHIAGDRVIYELVWDNEINMYVNEMKYIYTNSINLESFKEKFQIKNPKKRKLVKGLKQLSQNNKEAKENERPIDNEDEDEDEDEEEEEEEEKEEDGKNLPEKFNDEDMNGYNILRIFPRSQKKETKNLNVKIKGKVIEAYGKNSIILGPTKLNNLKKNDTFEILPHVRFGFLNYSNRDLRIKLEIIDI